MAAAKRSEQSAAGSELIGQLAGEYKILRKIGAGGFGTVFEAMHPLLQRKAAVKVLHANTGVDSVAVQRFIEEARSASQIRHRHIVDIFSFGTLANGQYFYVMDLLDGAPLDRYLADTGRIAPELAVPLLRPIASAIDALHAASLVHRDLKPANIFLAWDSSGEVIPKLLDFGLVKLLKTPSVNTTSGVPIGTPFYMSPEQAQGGKLDARADIYSFGVICFELLTGKVPFDGESATAVLLAHMLNAPPRPSAICPELNADVDEPVLAMLAKDPNARPNAATTAVRALQLAVQTAGITISESGCWLPRPQPPPPEPPAELGQSGELGIDATLEQSSVQGVPLSQRSERRVLGLWAAIPTLIVIAVLAAQLYRDDPQAVLPPTAATPAPVAPQPSAAGATPSVAATPPLAATVAVTVRGAPDGAEIKLGDQPLGAAPGPVEVPRGDSPVQLTIFIPGRSPRMVSVTPAGPDPVTVDLPPDKPRPPKRNPLSRDLEDPF